MAALRTEFIRSSFMYYIYIISIFHIFFRILNDQKSPSKIGNSYSENRRKDEDKLAVIFLVIILIFIFCHLPRVGIDIHEIYSLSHSNFCAKHHMPNTFPAWSLMAIYISHFCLVINAASNMFIYCLMSTKFREESRTIFRRFKQSP